jgi:hypothetical protein
MTTRCRRPSIALSASLAIVLLFTAPRSYARPQAEPQPPSGQPQTQQQTPAQQPQATAPNATPSPAQAPSAPPAADPNNPPSQTASDAGSKDRLFFALPNFLTLENSAHVPPMTAAQKYKVAVRSSFDYVQFPWYAALAGISQAQNSEPGYGQGAEGYAKRYGSAFADGTIENFMVNAVVPSVLHTDPRYYQLGKGGFVRRTGYALSRLFITRTDSGHNAFNFGEIGGSAAAAAISTYSYHPEADKTLSNTASVWGTQVGYDAIRIVLNEFWPDIRRKFHKEKAAPQP